MRKLFTAFLLVAFAMPALACDIRPARGLLFNPVQFTPVSYSLMGYRNRCSSPLMCSAPMISMMRKYDLPVMYPGIPFHNGAVFCRMENYALRKYNVKFSIHAGGFSE